MNKGELIDQFFAKNNDITTKAAAERAVNDVLGLLSDGIANGGVAIAGFGTFSVVQRDSHEARNPQTGDKVMVPAKKVVKFKAGKTLADSVQ